MRGGHQHIGDVLRTLARVIPGTVAVMFIPNVTDASPVAFAAVPHAELTNDLFKLGTLRLASGGPWGPFIDEMLSGWVEPVLTDDDRLIGAIVLDLRDHVDLSEEDRRSLRLFADVCANLPRGGAVELEMASQRRVDEFVLLISERLMSATAPTLQDSLDWVMESLSGFLRADVAYLRRHDHAAGTSTMIAEYPSRGLALSEDPLGIVPFASDPIFAVSEHLKVPLILPAHLDEHYENRVAEGTGGLRGFTGACVPLLHGEVTEGVLGFIYLHDPSWSEHEVRALRAVAAALAQVLYRIDAEEHLRYAALTDDLTGLANRRALLDEVERRQHDADAGSIALLLIDLDRFKVMNDHLGHKAGDQVLQVIADRIRTSLRPGDFAARFGGDEFVVVLHDEDGSLGAVATASRLLDLISLPIDVLGQRVAHTASVGIALGDQSGLTATDLLGRADIAVYEAKSQGRNRIAVFDSALEGRVAQRSSIELLLRQALDEHALRVLYQPEFDLRDGRILSVEALVRWVRPGYGLVEAAEFVPIAEETHLINNIDRWVLQTACMQAAEWHRAAPDMGLVTRVNLSAGQLALAGVVRSVADSLRHSGLPPHLLCLEITEQAVIADVDQAVRVLRDVRAMGVKLAIDDFGTGFSSMSQLRNLPVDTLKIDRVFVDGIAHDPTNQAIVETIIHLARAFKLDVVGEGVERTEDLETLVRIGCLRAQGYLLARPLLPEQLRPILERGGIDLTEIVRAGAT